MEPGTLFWVTTIGGEYPTARIFLGWWTNPDWDGVETWERGIIRIFDPSRGTIEIGVDLNAAWVREQCHRELA